MGWLDEMPAPFRHFEVIRYALEPQRIEDIRQLVLRVIPGNEGQNGFQLSKVPPAGGLLQPLELMASQWVGSRVKLRLDKSSCRVQRPDGFGKLGLHQDWAALGVDPNAVPCCVIWLPLQSIDQQTPTISIALEPQPKMLPHTRDASGYSVLGDGIDWMRIPILPLDAGDAVIFTGLTIHGTVVYPSHTKTRISLDLRFIDPAAARKIYASRYLEHEQRWVLVELEDIRAIAEHHSQLGVRLFLFVIIAYAFVLRCWHWPLLFVWRHLPEPVKERIRIALGWPTRASTGHSGGAS